VAGCRFAISHYQSHVAYFHWSTSIASVRNTDTWQAMAKPPQHHMTHGSISSHHITCICHVAVCCIATSPNPMLHGSTTLSHIRQTVPHGTVSLVHVSKWAPPQPRQPPSGSHQSATWQSAIWPHHHPMPHGITTSMHTGVLYLV
jgi:hypothetical protein